MDELMSTFEKQGTKNRECQVRNHDNKHQYGYECDCRVSLSLQRDMLEHLVKRPKPTHKGNGVVVYRGPHAFTLTKSPKDTETVGDMIAAVKKILKQQSCKVKKYAWYYEDKGTDEWGAALHPHIHGYYETETGGRIEPKHFRRAWPLWDEKTPLGAGFKGGYHRPVKLEEKYEDYIKKDGGMGEKYPTDN